MMSDAELKCQLICIINECEEIAQWVGEVQAAMGSDRYLRFDNMLDALYEQAVKMSSIAVNARLEIAMRHGKSDNKEDKNTNE